MAVLKGGVLLGSVYLRDGEGLSCSNVELINAVAGYVKACGMPFILGGDWQVCPEDMESSGLPAAMKARVVAPDGHTYQAGGHTSLIDYFLVSDCLFNNGVVVSCEVKDSKVIHKHKPVLLKVTGSCRSRKCKVMRRPKALPKERAQGCKRGTTDWSCALDAARQISDQASLDRAYKELAIATEKEVLDAACLDPADSNMCRAYPPRVVELPALAVHNGFPAASIQARTWRHLQAKLEEWMVKRSSPVANNRHDARNILNNLMKFVPSGGKPPEWSLWRKEIRELSKLHGEDADHMANQMVGWIGSIALAEEDARAVERADSWNEFCRKAAAEPGAPRVHAFARGKATWARFVKDKFHGTSCPQDDAEQRASPWLDMWDAALEAFDQDKEDEALEWPCFTDAEVDEIAMPTRHQYSRLCLSFPLRTGIGCCGYHPRHFDMTEETGYLTMIFVWKAILRLGLLPSQIRLLIMLLIPKDVGGDRPIGLFPSPIRLLSRWMRGTYGEQWRVANDRSYFYGARSRGATVCSWMVAAMAEYARMIGKEVAVALFDLVKAFEHISHWWLKNQAEKFGFNKVVLRFLVGLYSMPRRLRIGMLVTSLFRVFRTVVPGDSFADLLMRLAVMSVLDDVTVTYKGQGLHLACVVDDIQFLALGDVTTVTRVIAEASKQLVDDMGAIGLQVAVGGNKLSILTSSPELQSSLQKKLRLKGKKVKGACKKEARNLGVDLSLRKRSTKVQQGRLKKAVARGLRLRRIRKGGASAKRMAGIAKAGINAVALYGVGVTGMSDSAIDKARRVVHGVIEKKPHGRSATVDFELLADNLDPALEATIAPLVMWVCGVWLKWIPRTFMARSLHGAWGLAQKHSCMWQVAQGPAVAVLASLSRIGWSLVTPFEWKMANGMTINIEEVSAADVARLARRDVKDWIWRRAASRRSAFVDFTSAPFIAPLKTLMRAADRPDWGPEHKGMLRSIVADAWWGYGPCTLCGQEWSTWHCHWNCDAVRTYKQQYSLPSSIEDCASRGKDVPLFSCCLLPDPARHYPPPVLVQDLCWSYVVQDQAAEGLGNEAFGDGSGYNVLHDATRRCGFAVVAVVRAGISRFLGARVNGPLPGVVQEVPLAELWALLTFVRHAMPGQDGQLTFYSDCAWVVDSFAAGEATVTHPMCRFAGTWKVFFKALDDVVPNRSLMNVIKVKAHSSAASCDGDEELLFLKRGNDAADEEAKAGATRQPLCQEDLDRLRRCSIVQPIIAKFMARQAVHRRETFGQEVVPARPPSRRVTSKATVGVEGSVSATLELPDTGVHRTCLDPISMRVRCIKCLASADCAATLRKAPCVPESGVLKHKLWRCGDYIFCCNCGAHSQKRTLGLGQSCNGQPRSDSARDRKKLLLSGRHPLSGLDIGIPIPIVLWDDWHDSFEDFLAGSRPEEVQELLEFPELL